MKNRTFLLLIASLLAWVPAHAANVAIMTSIFSPDATVKLESNGELTNIRHPIQLPSSPFSLTTGAEDMVQVQLRDGSYVRLAPHSQARFVPLMDRVTVLHGTALIYFSESSALHITDFRMHGDNSMAMLTVDPNETRVLPLNGNVDFLGDRVKEGHIAIGAFNGKPTDIGPTNLDRIKAESPLLVDLPGSPPLAEQLKPSQTGLRASVDILNANSRREAEHFTQEMAKANFFGSGLANTEGSSAVISDIIQSRAPVSVGTSLNPSQTFAQITQNAINTAPPPPLPPVSNVIVAPPPPPPGTQLISFLGNWSVNALGVISDGVGPNTLAPFSLSGGVARYTVPSLTDNGFTFSLAGSAAFTAAGGTELNFTSTGAITFTGNNSGGGGGGFGNLTLTLNSTGAGTSVANVTTTGGAVNLTGQTGVTTTGAILTTGVAGTSGAAPTAGTAGGAVTMTSSAGNITLGGAVTANGGAGGNQTVAAAPANAGAGGAGGAISMTANQGTVTGGTALTSTGGAGGTNVGAATKAAALTAGGSGSGGAGGAIAVQAGGGGGGAGVTLGAISSTGGAAGATTGTFGLTGSGGAGGNISVGSTAAVSTTTVTSILSTGGAGDGGAALKLNGGAVGGVVGGDGGAGGTVTVNVSSATSTFNATTAGATGQVGSVGGASAAHTEVSQIVPKGGDGGIVTVTSGIIGTTGHPANTPQFFSQGGNGGLTGGTFAAPVFNEKGGMGGNGGTVSVTTTGAPNYAPNIASTGGNAGNTETPGGFSQVFNGVGGMGGILNITQTNPASTLDFSAAGGARVATVGGQEVASGAHGGSTSNGVNVNGALTINVGNNDLTITSPTAIANSGNGTASGYNRFANGGLGASTTLNSGVLTLGSRNLTINADGAVAAGGSSVVINSTGNVNIDTSAKVTLTPGIQAVNGVSIANATSVSLTSLGLTSGSTAGQIAQSATTPAIWNTAGTVNIDVSHGPGGAIVLGSNSILSSSSAANQSGGQTVGNITITGSGLTQPNGQLFGVSAAPLAGIASGIITVNKTPTGSTIDVGSAGRQGDPNAFPPGVPVYGTMASPALQTPTYSTPPQNGNAKIIGPPNILMASSAALTTTNPGPPPVTTKIAVPGYVRPYDDAQNGTAQLTTAPGTQPLMVGMIGNTPGGAALHNFNPFPTYAVQRPSAQFLAVTTAARTGLAGGASDATPATTAPAGSTVVVSNPSAVTVNR